jgi:glucose uptake protein
LAGGRWRFELFYIDFALGVIAAAAVLAWTLGTLGSELSFSDRIAVAGLRSQALAMGGGFLFNLGNMLLLGSVSLLGLSAAFPLACAVALIVSSLTGFHGVSLPLLGAGELLLIASVFTVIAARRDPLKTQPARAGNRPQNAPQFMQRRTKGAITGILGGLFIGGSYAIAYGAFWGDLGLGAYAGLLLFAVGMLISTAVFGLFFLNMAIDGGRLSLGSYLGGGFGQHALGWAGGIVWAAGMAAWLLAQSAPENEQAAYRLLLWTLQGSAIVALLWGLLVWREFQGRSAGSKRLIAVTAVLYVAGLAALGLRFR